MYVCVGGIVEVKIHTKEMGLFFRTLLDHKVFDFMEDSLGAFTKSIYRLGGYSGS